MQNLPIPLAYRDKLLLLFIFFSILPFSILAFFVTYIVGKSFEQNLLRVMNEKIQLQEQTVKLFLDTYQLRVRAFAHHGQLQKEIDAYSTDPKSPILFISRIKEKELEFEKVTLLDREGMVIAATDEKEIGKTLDTRTGIGRVNFDEYGKKVISFTSTVSDLLTGETIALLRVSVLADIFDSITKDINIDQSTKFYIIDDQSIPITNIGQLSGNENFSFLPVIACIKEGKHSEGLWENYAEQTMFGVSRCLTVDGANWTIVYEQPQRVAFQLKNQTQFTILVVAAVVDIVLVFAVVLLSRGMTKPIGALAKGVKAFGSGNLDYRIKLGGGDEFAELAQSYNEMADKLERSLDATLAETNKLTVVLSGINDAVIVVDAQRNIVMLNAAAEKLTGFQATRIYGKPIDSIIKVYQHDQMVASSVYCPIAEGHSEGAVYTAENLRFVAARENDLYINLTASHIRNGSLVNVGCILTIHDITAIKQTEDMKRDFVSMIAHELRTPLTAIRGYASLLAPTVTKTLDEENKEYFHRLGISADNLGKLIENLLSVSRIERGVFKVQLGPLDLLDTVRGVAKDLTEPAKIRGFTLKFVSEESQYPNVLADAFRIAQVLSNLVNNAMNYTLSGGTITVSIKKLPSDTQYENGRLAVSVTDTGQGIPKDAIAKLFTKFYRVSAVKEQGAMGTGLGLFICKSIVELHKGDIWVESEEGKGSTFTFTIPIATDLELGQAHATAKKEAYDEGGMRGVVYNPLRHPHRN